MAESFSRWESDPLFSAAEVVQDSADRMESVFRSLLHEENLAQGDPSDSKLRTLMQYHRRDLATALGTTKWQLEDFEREVNFAALYDNSKPRENAILKHRQFIRAIKEQILQVQRSMDSSMEESSKTPQWMNSNEQDTDGLASFLSGGDVIEQNLDYDTGNGIMRRFLDSNMDSDEIVELKTEGVEVLPMNGSSADHTSWKIGSTGQREHVESYTVPVDYDTEFSDLGAKYNSYKNRLKGSLWGVLRNFWLPYKRKGSYTKRRKDGEVTEDFIQDVEQRTTSSTFNIPPVEQAVMEPKYLMGTMHPLHDSDNAHLGYNLGGLLSPVQFYNFIEVIRRKLQRSQHVSLNNQFPIRLALAMLAMLTVLGFLAFHRA